MPKKVSTLNQIYPTDCPVLLQVRKDYADWIYLIEHEYIRYYKSENNKLFRKYEHQLVAQYAYGDIPGGHHVHHKNEDRKCNKSSNLEVLSCAEHSRVHKGISVILDLVCSVCGKPYTYNEVYANRGQNNYCSPACSSIGQRRVERPTAERLAELMDTVSNWTMLGEMFNVSDNAVRNWAKRYNLDLSMCDGRKIKTQERVARIELA